MDTLIQVFADTKHKHPKYKDEFEKINKELIKLKQKIDFDANIKISVFYYNNYQSFKKCFSKKFIMSNKLISTSNTNHYAIIISKLRDTKYIFVCKDIKDMYKICYLVEEKYKYVKEFKNATIPMTLTDFANTYNIDFDILNSLNNEILCHGDYNFDKISDVVKSVEFV